MIVDLSSEQHQHLAQQLNAIAHLVGIVEIQ